MCMCTYRATLNAINKVLLPNLRLSNILFSGSCSILSKNSSVQTGNMDSQTPAFPPGYTQEDNGRQILITASLFIFLEISVVILRCATRIRYKTKWGADDFLMAPALLCCLGLCVSATGK
jgi:hypothetical protein